MFGLIGPAVGLAVLTIIIIFLFMSLKDITLYNVAIFIFLVLFWSVMASMKKVMRPDHESTPNWVWALAFSAYQFTQVFTRLPLGKLSQKLRSRKQPILYSTATITVSLLIIALTNFSTTSIMIGMVVTGVFGATFGLQNQYWSENYNIRSVYWTIAIVAIIPSYGSLVGDLSRHFVDPVKNVNLGKWYLIGLAVFLFIIATTFLFFKERKETIRLDNSSSGENSFVAKLTMRDVIRLSLRVTFVSFAFNLITTRASYQDAISSYAGETSTFLTFISIITALVTASYLAQFFKIQRLIYIAHTILFLGIILGIILEFSEKKSLALQIVYLSVITVGFTLFQNVMIGSALHFDHKNKILVLGIWLTIRSAAFGSGQFVGEYTISSYPGALKYLLIAALVLSIFSLSAFIYAYYRKANMFKLFALIDKYEYRSRKTSWKPLRRTIK